MKKWIFLTFVLILTLPTQAQKDSVIKSSQFKKKGSLYIYWGWNLDKYTPSNIKFSGDGYNFTLYDVKAVDRPSPAGYNPYFKPDQITIPQYNFRIGYFISEHLNISVGVDHMKYVMVQNQYVGISGNIENSGTKYDGIYENNSQIELTNDFLKFEHTDGLNYLNSEVNYFSTLKDFSAKNNLNYTCGLGAGVLYPRSDVTLLSKEENNDFHIAGYGISAKVGLNFTFLKYFFLQTELKAGYINMPDILTTVSGNDRAEQHFDFLQGIGVFGFNIPITNKQR